MRYLLLLVAACSSHPHTEGPIKVRVDEDAVSRGRGGEGMPSFGSTCTAHIEIDPPQDVPLEGFDCASVHAEEPASGAYIVFTDDSDHSYKWTNPTIPQPLD